MVQKLDLFLRFAFSILLSIHVENNLNGMQIGWALNKFMTPESEQYRWNLPLRKRVWEVCQLACNARVHEARAARAKCCTPGAQLRIRLTELLSLISASISGVYEVFLWQTIWCDLSDWFYFLD